MVVEKHKNIISGTEIFHTPEGIKAFEEELKKHNIQFDKREIPYVGVQFQYWKKLPKRRS